MNGLVSLLRDENKRGLYVKRLCIDGPQRLDGELGTNVSWTQIDDADERFVFCDGADVALLLSQVGYDVRMNVLISQKREIERFHAATSATKMLSFLRNRAAYCRASVIPSIVRCG